MQQQRRKIRQVFLFQCSHCVKMTFTSSEGRVSPQESRQRQAARVGRSPGARRDVGRKRKRTSLAVLLMKG